MPSATGLDASVLDQHATRIRADALGHTLFGNSSFLSDLAALTGEGKPPDERRLLAVRRGTLTYWRFRGDGR